MKLLENKANVNAPNATWPFGEVRDKTVSIPGTKWDKEMMSDIIQTFSKLFDESGLTANGQEDNETNGFQLFEALKRVTRPYKVYSVLVSQTGTNAPTVDVLENTLGFTPVWSRSTAGSYDLTEVGGFPNDKTFVMVNSLLLGALYVEAIHDLNNNTISVRSKTGAGSGTLTDGLLNKAPLEIRVYY